MCNLKVMNIFERVLAVFGIMGKVVKASVACKLITRLKEDLDKLSGEYKKIVAESSSFRGMVGTLEKEVDESKGRYNTLVNKCNTLETMNNRLKSGIADLEEQLKTAVDDKNNAVTKFETTNKNLKTTKLKLKVETTEHDNCKQELEKLLSEMKELEDTPVKQTGKAKLTCKQVKAIRKASAKGASDSSLGEEYGVSRTTISRIVAGKTYKNCTGKGL